MSPLQSPCPICDATVSLKSDVVESERLQCASCNNYVVVDAIKDGAVSLKEAPSVEEDWGE